MLRKAASQHWGVPLEEVETEASVLHHRASNRSARYGEMAAAAAELDPPSDLKLKEKSAYRIVGKKRYKVRHTFGPIDDSVQIEYFNRARSRAAGLGSLCGEYGFPLLQR